MRSAILGGLLCLCAPALAQPIALRGVVHVGDGSAAIADGGVVVEGGKITAVGAWGALTLPAGTRVMSGGHITPGLIDACSTVGVESQSWAEHGDEVVPQLRVLDAVDLRHVEFERMARRGVTAVYVTPGPGSVVGSQGCVVKTAGPLGQRVVQAAGAVKVNLGPEAWERGVGNRGPWGSITFSTRRPTTLMGAVWVFRDAFSRAQRGALGGAAEKTLSEVLGGKRPLRIQARRRGEIEAAVRLAAEFGLRFVLEEGTEAYELLDLLATARVPVIFGPISDRARGYRARTGEADRPCLSTAKLLADKGIPFCLTANDRRDEDGLWAQGMWAVRYGLTTDQAVQALTGSPAGILGPDVAKRVGRLAAGLDADVVLWSGLPFEATTRARLVLVDGEVRAGALEAEAPAEEPKRTPDEPADEDAPKAPEKNKTPGQRFK